MRYQGKTGQQHLLQDLNPLSSIPTLGSKAWPPPKKNPPSLQLGLNSSLLPNHDTKAFSQSLECPWFPPSLIFAPPQPNHQRVGLPRQH